MDFKKGTYRTKYKKIWIKQIQQIGGSFKDWITWLLKLPISTVSVMSFMNWSRFTDAIFVVWPHCEETCGSSFLSKWSSRSSLEITSSSPTRSIIYNIKGCSVITSHYINGMKQVLRKWSHEQQNNDNHNNIMMKGKFILKLI